MLGYCVAIGAENVTATAGGQTYTWKSNRSYWFSVSGGYFNISFVMTSWTHN